MRKPVFDLLPLRLLGLALGWVLARRWPFGLAVALGSPFLLVWPFMVADVLGGAGASALVVLLLLVAPAWAFLMVRAALRAGNPTR